MSNNIAIFSSLTLILCLSQCLAIPLSESEKAFLRSEVSKVSNVLQEEYTLLYRELSDVLFSLWPDGQTSDESEVYTEKDRCLSNFVTFMKENSNAMPLFVNEMLINRWAYYPAYGEITGEFCDHLGDYHLARYECAAKWLRANMPSYFVLYDPIEI